MTETRYAILIGMDNYPGDELPYCVKDVKDLEKTLVSHCRFKKENIYKITDSRKSVKQQIDDAFLSIEQVFHPKQDLLFFYFSGHGEYDTEEGKSKILFEDDTALTIEDILIRYFVKITPKNQYLLIDACHSGSRVFFKGNNNPEKEIRRLNHNSHELCLMFATESKKKAVQGGDIKNSYFTYFLIEAIKREILYDEDGFLTIQAIDNYLKKKVMEKSDFVQIPVSEIRSSGYKVFSFNERTIKQKMKSQRTKNTLSTSALAPQQNGKEILQNEISFEESLLPKYRTEAQEKYSQLIQDSVDTLLQRLNSSEYDAIASNPLQEIDYSDQQKIYMKVIKKSEQEGIEPVSGLFEISLKEKNKTQNLLGLGSIMNFLFEESKPTTEYYINPYSDQIYIAGISVKAKNLYQVTGGIIVLFYQAKYGFAIAIVTYHYNWTGTDERELNFIKVTINPYLLNGDNDKSVSAFLTSEINNFTTNLKSWCAERLKDIERFKSKVTAKKEN